MSAGSVIRNADGGARRSSTGGLSVHRTDDSTDCDIGDCGCGVTCRIYCQEVVNGPLTPVEAPCCLRLQITGLITCGCVGGFLECFDLGSCQSTLRANAVDIDIILGKDTGGPPQAGGNWSGSVLINGLGQVFPADFSGDPDDPFICENPCGEFIQVVAEYHFSGRRKLQYLLVKAYALLAGDCPFGCVKELILFRCGHYTGPFDDGDDTNDVCTTGTWPATITLASQLTHTGDILVPEEVANSCGTHDPSGEYCSGVVCAYETIACYGGTATLTPVESPVPCPTWDGVTITPALDPECLPFPVAFCDETHCCYQASVLEHTEGGGCTELGITPLWIRTAACDLEGVVWYFNNQSPLLRRCYRWHATTTPFGRQVNPLEYTVVTDCDDANCIPVPPTACKCWHHWKATYTLGPCDVSLAYIGTECAFASDHLNGTWVDTDGECSRDYWVYLDDCANDPCEGGCTSTPPADPVPPTAPPRDQCPNCGTCDCFDCCVGQATATISGTGFTIDDGFGGFYYLDGVHLHLIKQSTCNWHNFANLVGNGGDDGFAISVQKITGGPDIGKWRARAFDASGCEIRWLLNSTACCPFHAATSWDSGVIVDPSHLCPPGIACGTFSWSC